MGKFNKLTQKKENCMNRTRANIQKIIFGDSKKKCFNIDFCSSRVATNQERLLMAQVRYLILPMNR